MILTVINGKTFFDSYDTRLEELEAFQQKCEVWGIIASEAINNPDPGISAVFKKTGRSIMMRIIEGSGGYVRTETVVMVTVVDDGGFFDKEWCSFI